MLQESDGDLIRNKSSRLSLLTVYVYIYHSLELKLEINIYHGLWFSIVIRSLDFQTIFMTLKANFKGILASISGLILVLFAS